VAKRTKEQRRAERRAFYLRHRERLLREMKEYRDHKLDRMKAAAYQRSYYLKNKDRLNVLNREYYHKHKIRLNRVNTARRRAGIIKTDMSPAATATTPLNPLTCTGVSRWVIVPSPTCP